MAKSANSANVNTSFQCPACNSKSTIKKGKKKNKLQTIQRYKCKICSKIFTLNPVKGITYPLSIILKSISLYNVGCTLKESSDCINKKNQLRTSPQTISSWLSEYKSICTYSRLRKEATSLYKPKELIYKQALNHIQPYTFKCHKAKLDILTKENPQFSAIKGYIEKISTKNFPHHIFTYNKNNGTNENIGQRASQLKFTHLNIKLINKTNQSNELAKLALNLAKSNNERHQKLQDFFLINDSTTIATELPIYLTNWDAGYYRNQRGFIFPLNNYKTPITGHIDILQIRNGLIHILDYKPEADKINPIEQLTIYALSLSRKLNLPLYHFKCAWFDENNYYEFFPLHAVYENRKV